MHEIEKIRHAIGKEINIEARFYTLNYILKLLSNPLTEKYGRELVIRILDSKETYSDSTKLLKYIVRKCGLYPYLISEFDNLSTEETLVVNLYKPNMDDTEFTFHSLQKLVYSYLIKKTT